MNHLFAYGTLMDPYVFRGVTGLDRQPVDATLAGHRRLRVADAAYPGLVVVPDAPPVRGVVYDHLPPDIWEVLDAYEGPEYDRVVARPQRNDGQTVAAWVYLTSDAGRPHLLPEAWTLEEDFPHARAWFERGGR